MSLPSLVIDTARSDNSEAKSAAATEPTTEHDTSSIDQPISSSSPTIRATKAPVKAATGTKLDRKPTAAQNQINKELDNAMFELETEDLELLEQRVAELESYLGIEDMDLDYFVKN